MWDKFKLWLFNIGAFMFDFTTTKMGQFMKEYGPQALEIVMEVAMLPVSGAEKRAAAIAKLMALVPEILADEDYAIATVKGAYEIWIAKQEKIDTDGDGVPDYRDLCKLVGDQGCGVDENGCPIQCEPDPDCPDGTC